MDPVTLAMAMRRVTRGREGIAWLGDSLTANGSTPNPSMVMNLDSGVSVGATTIVVSNPYAAYPSQGTPAATNLLVLDPGLATEEHVVIPAAGVTGTGPWTITVPALANAHASGAVVRTEARQWGAQSVPMWTHLLSNGRLRFAGVYAHGSYTAQEAQTVYLPQVIAAKPAVCVVCLGANPGTYTLTDIDSYVIPIWQALLSAGIQPVCVGLPPQNSNVSSSTFHVERMNARLAHEARKRGIPCYLPFKDLVATGSGPETSGAYLTGNNVDNTHPSEIGARIWAQSLVTLLDNVGVLRPLDAFLVSAQIYSGDTTLFPLGGTNNLMLTDSNADGIPDGWTKSSSNAGDTITLGAVTGFAGNALQYARVVNGTTDPIVVSPAWTGTPQHRYRVMFRLATSGMDAAYNALMTSTASATTSTFGGLDLRITTGTADTDALGSIKTWKRDITGPTTVVFEFVHPAGLSSNSLQLRMQMRGSASTPAYTTKIGQLTVIDLTALGATS